MRQEMSAKMWPQYIDLFLRHWDEPSLYYTPHKSLASGPNGYFVVSLGDRTSKVWCYAPSALKRLLCHSLSSQPTGAYVKHLHLLFRGTQRQFSENICSEDDLRSRIFGNICCKISCLPASPRIFEHLKNGIISHF